MSHSDSDFQGGISPQALAEAQAALGKLPALGPIAWLYARDASRRYTFVGDLEWRVLPPLVLDQCKIYFKAGIPFCFVTWAKVSDAVHDRLKSGVPTIAPHEWNGGPHIWLVEVVTPFGPEAEFVDDVRNNIFRGQGLYRILPGAGQKSDVEELSPGGTVAMSNKH